MAWRVYMKKYLKLVAIKLSDTVIVPILVALISSVLLMIIYSDTSDENEIREIINQEAIYVLEGKFDEAIALFDEDATVKDAAGVKPWFSKEEIMNRYKGLPEFDKLKHDAIEVEFTNKNHALAVGDTNGRYTENGRTVTISSNNGEEWAFEKINGEWKITSFTYNL